LSNFPQTFLHSLPADTTIFASDWHYTTYYFWRWHKKVLVLVNAMVQAKNGVLFIDEVETAIHKNITMKFSGLL